MSRQRIFLPPDGLEPAVIERTRQALDRGAMQPIDTETQRIEDAGVRFIVRSVSSLQRKHAQRVEPGPGRAAGKPANPFLPPEPELLVAEISATHRAVLNKFNVIDRHLLIVTRRYEAQETLLDRHDFAALAACMAQIDGLGFYNGGIEAGASQPHKHLQLVPLPLGGSDLPVPMAALFDNVRGVRGVCRVPALPFPHAVCWIEDVTFNEAHDAAEKLQRLYHDMLDASGLLGVAAGGRMRQSAPYNLLLTREWMLLVPRSRECFEEVSVNALGFAGSLFVRNAEQLEAVRRAGPMAVLQAVAVT